LFAWIRATTPFGASVWRVMAQLGSRLFFLVTDTESEVTVEDLINAGTGPSYSTRLGLCRTVVHPFLTKLFQVCGGVRGVKWDSAADPISVRDWIARIAKVLVAMRSQPVAEKVGLGDDHGYAP